MEVGGSDVQGPPQLQIEFMVSLGYLRHRKNKRKKVEQREKKVTVLKLVEGLVIWENQNPKQE